MRIPAIFRPWRVRVGTVLAVTLLAVVVGMGVVRATHGGLHPTILARAPFAEPFDMKVKASVAGEQELVQVRDAADVIVQEVIVDPGQGHVHSAWNHSTTTPVKVYVTYFDVPPELDSPLIPAANPGFCTGF